MKELKEQSQRFISKATLIYFKFDILNGRGFCFFDTMFNNFVCKNLLYKCFNIIIYISSNHSKRF